ncbi:MULTISPECIES: LysR family transcriptional regulator [Shewanella]|uniref:LysR family transcriptional regulator n=1 Tax=Shewanella japonica TaxID=93973 RepID=A0ABN4YQU6_9GAMM|nr:MULTISPECIES: LysR family transcriptional regulator [Shewanella]ARD24094.1 LysR family transcriptional regulator [Shewanella japonica]KPZ69106.1 HTH-type transcriptional regulator DmlR [Shewanella sp. P1-14-1]MBQ4891344.1 LysR family transcriptional regulator [Shewanella sp. MMG014]OBT04707.1 LysR family transcriptional regulator [Shewanella sp. UCD-FRSSP16_17]
MSLTKQLALFVDVVQQGSFTKAATLHDMDNSLLSKQIKKLETELGVQLLNRSTRSFSLTSAGEEILAQALQLTDTLSQVQNIADSYQSKPKGIIRITSGVYFGQLYLQPVITRFMKQYPEVKVTLNLDDKRTDIITDHFDVAFRVGKLTESNLIARKIAKTHFAIVASECFIQEHGMPMTPEELIQLPAVVYGNGNVNLDQMCLTETPHGDLYKMYKMRGNYKVSDVRTLIDAVKSGLGYSLIDLFNLEEPIAQSKLVPLLTNYGLSTMDTGIYAVYPHRKQTLLVSEFIKAVQEYIGTPPFWLEHIPNYKQLYQ